MMIKILSISFSFILLLTFIIVVHLKSEDTGYSTFEYNFNEYYYTNSSVKRVTLYSVPECSQTRSEKWMIDNKFDHTSAHGEDAKLLWRKLQDYTDTSPENISKRIILNQDYQLVIESNNNFKTTFLITHCFYSKISDDVILYAKKEERLCQIILQKRIATQLGIKGL